MFISNRIRRAQCKWSKQGPFALICAPPPNAIPLLCFATNCLALRPPATAARQNTPIEVPVSQTMQAGHKTDIARLAGALPGVIHSKASTWHNRNGKWNMARRDLISAKWLV